MTRRFENLSPNDTFARLLRENGLGALIPVALELDDEGNCPVTWLPNQSSESQSSWQTFCEKERTHFHIIVSNQSSYPLVNHGNAFETGHQGPMPMPERIEPGEKHAWGVSSHGDFDLATEGGTAFLVEGTPHGFAIGYNTFMGTIRTASMPPPRATVVESGSPKDAIIGSSTVPSNLSSICKVGNGKLVVVAFFTPKKNMRYVVIDGPSR